MSAQPSQFKITKASFTADRIGGFEELFFDIKNQIVEINMVFQIYECRSVDQETMTMYGYSRNDPE